MIIINMANNRGMTRQLTCSAEVFLFVLEEQDSPTAFLLSLFSMAHSHCAGHDSRGFHSLKAVT